MLPDAIVEQMLDEEDADVGVGGDRATELPAHLKRLEARAGRRHQRGVHRRPDLAQGGRRQPILVPAEEKEELLSIIGSLKPDIVGQ